MPDLIGTPKTGFLASRLDAMPLDKIATCDFNSYRIIDSKINKIVKYN